MSHAEPTVVDPDTEAAQRHYARGRQLYDQKKYQEALSEFQEARTLRDLPALDYNLGKVQERLEAWGAAADSYEKYLAVQPNDPDAANLRARVSVLRERAAGKNVTLAPVSKLVDEKPVQATPVAQAHSPFWRRWWFWTAVGVGVAVIGAGIGLAVAYTTPNNAAIPPSTLGNVGITFR